MPKCFNGQWTNQNRRYLQDVLKPGDDQEVISKYLEAMHDYDYVKRSCPNKNEHGWFNLTINTNKGNGDDIKLVNEDGIVVIDRSQTKEEDFCLYDTFDSYIIVHGCL